jgi:hypothetical protein
MAHYRTPNARQNHQSMDSDGWTTVERKPNTTTMASGQATGTYVPPHVRKALEAKAKAAEAEFPALVSTKPVKRVDVPDFGAVVKKQVADEAAADADASVARAQAEAKLTKRQREMAMIAAEVAKLPSLSAYLQRRAQHDLEDARRRRRARLFPSGRMFDSYNEEAAWHAQFERPAVDFYTGDAFSDDNSVDEVDDSWYDPAADSAEEEDAENTGTVRLSLNVKSRGVGNGAREDDTSGFQRKDKRRDGPSSSNYGDWMA